MARLSCRLVEIYADGQTDAGSPWPADSRRVQAARQTPGALIETAYFLIPRVQL
jgi:hypothetical protein